MANALRIREIPGGPGLLLVAIESVDVQGGGVRGGFLAQGRVAPVAVVVCAPDATYAVDMDAKPLVVDELRRELPELDAAITAFEDANP